MTVVDILTHRLEKSLTGWAKLSVADTFHHFRPSTNPHYLQACSHTSLLPIHGAKLKQRDELPDGAKVCLDCERRSQ